MSGSAIAQWEIPTNQLELAKRQALLLNCPDENVQNMIKCLKQVCFPAHFFESNFYVRNFPDFSYLKLIKSSFSC